MPIIAQSVATLDAVVKCIRLKLRDWPLEDRLTGAYTSGGGVLAVSDGTQWAVGDELEVDDTAQSVYLIRSISSNNLTVKTGHRGSTEANHSSGATVRKRMRFTRQEIEDAIGHAVGMLYPEVYDITTTTLTYNANTHPYYAFPSDGIDRIFARQKISPSSGAPEYYFFKSALNRNGYPWEVSPGMPVADFASGRALYFPLGWYRTNAGDTIEVTYSRKVTTSTVSTGLMSDIVCWGACDHLLSSSMIHRSSPAFDGNPEVTSALDSLRSSLQADRHFRAGKNRLRVELDETYPPAGYWRW
jgi:hypothetical protein